MSPKPDRDKRFEPQKAHTPNKLGEVGFEPTSLAARDFKSLEYTVPPLAPKSEA